MSCCITGSRAPGTGRPIPRQRPCPNPLTLISDTFSDIIRSTPQPLDPNINPGGPEPERQIDRCKRVIKDTAVLMAGIAGIMGATWGPVSTTVCLLLAESLDLADTNGDNIYPITIGWDAIKTIGYICLLTPGD